jgi:hypothetical protein
MKKLSIFIAVAALFIACNDSAREESAPTSTSAEKNYSPAKADTVMRLPDSLLERRPDQIIDTNSSKDQ